jgi:two-component system response regulator HydG
MNQTKEPASAVHAAPAAGSPGLVRVLVVDNDIVHARTMGEVLGRLDYQVTVVGSGTEGARKLEQDSFDVVVTDLMMNDIGGLEILARAKQASAETEVIVVTGHGTIPSAVAAMQQGAFTYLQKPLDLAHLRSAVEKASAGVRLKRQNLELNRRLDEKFGFEGVVGSSAQMLALVERLKRIAPTDATVLIQGETGTGKELVAQAIHQNSPRKSKPFVALNCAALSENIKLLRVLESGEITRVGSNTPTRVNVRILSATNRNLEDAIATGVFRSDLYHRLKVVTIAIPTLQERAADIPLLIEHFIRQFAKRHGKTIKGMSLAARMKLGSYDWPGNVRQLRNVIESMVVVDCDELLDVDDLPLEFAPETSAATAEVAGSPAAAAGGVEAGLATLVGRPLEEVERILITETLKLTGGNREQAAEMLGIGERTLYRKIKEYQLP